MCEKFKKFLKIKCSFIYSKAKATIIWVKELKGKYMYPEIFKWLSVLSPFFAKSRVIKCCNKIVTCTHKLILPYQAITVSAESELLLGIFIYKSEWDVQ